jgi:hypothetical protein
MLCYGWVLARQGRSVARTPVPAAGRRQPARPSRHARSNPVPSQSLSVTSAPAAPAATLTSRTATFTPVGLTSFLLRWFPRKRFRGNVYRPPQFSSGGTA